MIVIQLVELLVEVIDPAIKLNDVVPQPEKNAYDRADCDNELDILVHDIALSDAYMP